MKDRSVPLTNFPTFGELLKYLRKRAQLSQRELAISVGYSDSQISRLEANLRAPAQASLLALFVPALAIESEPDTIRRLLVLAQPGGPKAPGQAAVAPEKAHPHNLPLQLTSFIGREQEIATLHKMITSGPARLVTLIGSGGVGKTAWPSGQRKCCWAILGMAFGLWSWRHWTILGWWRKLQLPR